MPAMVDDDIGQEFAFDYEAEEKEFQAALSNAVARKLQRQTQKPNKPTQKKHGKQKKTTKTKTKNMNKQKMRKPKQNLRDCYRHVEMVPSKAMPKPSKFVEPVGSPALALAAPVWVPKPSAPAIATTPMMNPVQVPKPAPLAAPVWVPKPSAPAIATTPMMNPVQVPKPAPLAAPWRVPKPSTLALATTPMMNPVQIPKPAALAFATTPMMNPVQIPKPPALALPMPMKPGRIPKPPALALPMPMKPGRIPKVKPIPIPTPVRAGRGRVVLPSEKFKMQLLSLNHQSSQKKGLKSETCNAARPSKSAQRIMLDAAQPKYKPRPSKSKSQPEKCLDLDSNRLPMVFIQMVDR